MKNLMELKAILAHHKDELKKKYNIKEIGIFGSYAYGLDFVTLAEELEAFLEVNVDLVSANAIKPNMISSVKEHLIYV